MVMGTRSKYWSVFNIFYSEFSLFKSCDLHTLVSPEWLTTHSTLYLLIVHDLVCLYSDGCKNEDSLTDGFVKNFGVLYSQVRKEAAILCSDLLLFCIHRLGKK